MIALGDAITYESEWKMQVRENARTYSSLISDRINGSSPSKKDGHFIEYFFKET